MRCKQKKELIKKIKKSENWDMLDKIEEMLKEEPKYITDFITEMFEKDSNYCGLEEVYCNENVIKAFEMDIRRIWLKIKNNIVPQKDYIDHWSELYVETKVNSCSTKTYEEDLDLWIMEQGFMFDSRDLAWVIFNIYCEKVTFKE